MTTFSKEELILYNCSAAWMNTRTLNYKRVGFEQLNRYFFIHNGLSTSWSWYVKIVNSGTVQKYNYIFKTRHCIRDEPILASS